MSTRSLTSKYDPIPSNTSEPSADIFEILNSSGPLQTGGLTRYEHSIPIDPRSKGVPWHSTISYVRRNIYWRIADEQAGEVFMAIERNKAKNQDSSMKTANSSEFELRKSRLVDVAVSFALNLWPDTSEKRMSLMAQSMAYIFSHDDIKEMDTRTFSELDNGDLIEQNGNGSCSIAKNKTTTEGQRNLATELRDNILAEDPETGIDFWNSIMSWAQHNATYSDEFVAKHDNFNSYLNYRLTDIGIEIAETGLRWGYHVNLSSSERQVGLKMKDLLFEHFTLVNDVYSFDKEYREHVIQGTVLVNAVSVLTELYSLSDTTTAKCILWSIIRDIENRMRTEYEDLRISRTPPSTGQWRYVDALLECAAGNIFCSATIARYGGPLRIDQMEQ